MNAADRRKLRDMRDRWLRVYRASRDKGGRAMLRHAIEDVSALLDSDSQREPVPEGKADEVVLAALRDCWEPPTSRDLARLTGLPRHVVRSALRRLAETDAAICVEPARGSQPSRWA